MTLLLFREIPARYCRITGYAGRLNECYIRTRAARTRRNISAWLSDSDKRVAVIKRTGAPFAAPAQEIIAPLLPEEISPLGKYCRGY